MHSTDRDMQRTRLERMMSGYSASASDAAANSTHGVAVYKVKRLRRCHRGEFGAGAGGLQAGRGDASAAADLAHTIAFDNDEPRLVRKVIRLIDSTIPLSAIGFPALAKAALLTMHNKAANEKAAFQIAARHGPGQRSCRHGA